MKFMMGQPLKAHYQFTNVRTFITMAYRMPTLYGKTRAKQIKA